MSCLLLKTSDGHLPSECTIHACGESTLSKCLEGCPCWCSSDQLLHGMHGYNNESKCLAFSPSKSSAPQQVVQSTKEEVLPCAIYSSKNDCQDVCEDLESSNVATKAVSSQEHQVEWEDNVVDNLVSILVSKLHLSLESPALHTGNLQECQESDAKDVKPTFEVESVPKVSVTCLNDGNGIATTRVPEQEVSNRILHDDHAKLRSALRGGYESAGLGCRPNMNVSWAPDVYDPPCTSSSHTSSQTYRRHHHHPKVDHKSRHKGKPSKFSDSQKKSQRRHRRLKHGDEFLLSSTPLFPEMGHKISLFSVDDYMTPSIDDDDLIPKCSSMRPCALLQKPCYLSPAMSFGESELVNLDKMQSCHLRHMTAQKLLA